MKKFRSLFATVLALSTFIMSFAFIAPANAQSQPGSGIQISPPRHEVVVNQGQQKNVIVTVKNVTSGTIIAKPVINDFEADNETGDPKIIASSKEDLPSSIKKFITGLSDTRLAAGEEKDLNIGIAIPDKASPGAYYGVIRYQALPDSPNEEKGQVSLSASVGVIILIEVPGETKKGMELSYLRAEANGKTGTIFTSKPNNMLLSVKNTGNTFIRPFGRVSILDPSGKEVYNYGVNGVVPRGNVLPNSNRIFKNEIKNINKFGKYQVKASIGINEGGEVTDIVATFWYVPKWLVGIVAAIIVLVATMAAYLRHKHQHSRKHTNRR